MEGVSRHVFRVSRVPLTPRQSLAYFGIGTESDYSDSVDGSSNCKRLVAGGSLNDDERTVSLLDEPSSNLEELLENRADDMDTSYDGVNADYEDHLLDVSLVEHTASDTNPDGSISNNEDEANHMPSENDFLDEGDRTSTTAMSLSVVSNLDNKDLNMKSVNGTFDNGETLKTNERRYPLRIRCANDAIRV